MEVGMGESRSRACPLPLRSSSECLGQNRDFYLRYTAWQCRGKAGEGFFQHYRAADKHLTLYFSFEPTKRVQPKAWLSLSWGFSGECVIKGRNLLIGLNEDCWGIVCSRTWHSMGLCFRTSELENFLILSLNCSPWLSL